jgi:hypothetical protein
MDGPRVLSTCFNGFTVFFNGRSTLTADLARYASIYRNRA